MQGPKLRTHHAGDKDPDVLRDLEQVCYARGVNKLVLIQHVCIRVRNTNQTGSARASD